MSRVVSRGEALHFQFDGTAYRGQHGDTLAAALLANGVHLMGRSFKYHRPRGVLGAGTEEPNALVTVGARCKPQHAEPARHRGRALRGLGGVQPEPHPLARLRPRGRGRLFAPLLGAGFYYRSFIHPHGAWHALYEPLIRRAAGLGRAPAEADPDRYAQRHAHCDVLVAGGGPAGLAAALAAGRQGARVILADEQAEFGGTLRDEATAHIGGQPAAAWLAATLAELRTLPRVTLLPRTTVFGYFQQNFLGLAQRLTDHLAEPPPGAARERLWQVRAREVVLATGAIERPLVFPGNDRPGVMLASAARHYLNRHGVAVGKRVALFVTEDSAYGTALDLHRAGIAIAGIIDLRPTPDGPGHAAARAAGLPVRPGCVVTGTSGRRRIRAVRLGRIAANRQVVADGSLTCDALLMGGGWTPSVHLFSQSRGTLRFDDHCQAYVPSVSAQRERSAGATAGRFGIATALADGLAAGAAAAGLAEPSDPPPEVTGEIPPGPGHLGAVPQPAGRPTAPAFVDFQNDVTEADIAGATAEGFRAIEHVKRFTTTGMATDQGRTSNMNALAIAAAQDGRSIPEVGHTRYRMPTTPVSFGSFAGLARGALFDPVRHTPTHGWAVAQGARFEDVGQWQRAWFFPRAGEDMDAAVARECRMVRTSVGLFDASTLGKIEVAGPDAAAFLDRMYVAPIARLAIGRSRYSLMLSEAGFVIDDGIIGRLAPDRFHVTTTTGGAARVLAQMEDYRQTEFPELQAWLTSTTEHWATFAIQGPLSRDALAPLVQGIDIAALPHMGVRSGHVAGVASRLFRTGFTGELGFEVNVPAEHAMAVWQALADAVAAQGGGPYGTEAMHVLRAEKGYIVVGQETDGTVTPNDLGMAGMIGRTSRDFVGRRSLSLPDLVLPDRKQLVGLLPADPGWVPQEGAQVIDRTTPPPGLPALGHVTSAYHSATLGRSIALALVSGGRTRHGQTVYLTASATAQQALVVDPVFLDRAGSRLHG